MNTESNDFCLAELDPSKGVRQEMSLGTRIDRNGKTTYHVLSEDRRAGVFHEKVYDQDHHLVRLQKRAPGSRSETFFNPYSGAVTRITESCSLPDGNSMTKNIVYDADDRSNEAIIVLAPNGELVRRVERQHIGLRTIFQGQTEYQADGTPATTVNHVIEPATGRLKKREQIQWCGEGQRSMTESFHFDQIGALYKYVKVLYHSNAGPFIEETVFYESKTQMLQKREIAAFGVSGKQTCLDVLVYDDEGEVIERHSMFYDRDGKEIASLNR